MPDKNLSVLICGYGDFYHFTTRCIESVINEPYIKDAVDVHVGLNACCEKTIEFTRRQMDMRRIDSIIESTFNINKDPMMRLLIGRATTPYIMWLDDDSHMQPGWLVEINKLLEKEKFDVAGHVYFWNRTPEYQELVEARPWWGGMEKRNENQRKQVFFATGGCFIARTEFLRKHNFPDRNMLKKWDDILLGDLIQDAGGKLHDFKKMMPYVKISDGKRRGTGEDRDAYITSENKSTEL